MKLLILSDLHLEFGTFFVPQVDYDVVILAEDISVPGSNAIQSSTRTIQQVLTAATVFSGGDLEAAILWYRNEPLALFDNRTAESLVAEGRAADVLSLLESFQAGFVG